MINEIKTLSEFKCDILKSKGLRLVVFDIDDTLITCNEYVGSENWYNERVRKYQNEEKTLELATYLANEEWEYAQLRNGNSYLESETKQIFDEIKKDFLIVGITARRLEFSEVTKVQLNQLSLSFQNTLWESIPNQEFPIRAGIVYVGPLQCKGQFLKKLLTLSKVKPDSIFAVDDRLKHLESYQKIVSGSIHCYHLNANTKTGSEADFQFVLEDTEESPTLYL